MQTINIELLTLEATEMFGRLLGQSALQGDIIVLNGDLGAGKTTLTQAIARGLDVPAEMYVSSPSFNILHEYPGRIPLYHMDFYRLQSEDDVVDGGFDEYFYKNGLTVIEWGDRAASLMPPSHLSIFLQLHENTRRTANCTYRTEYWDDRLRFCYNTLL